MTPKSHRVFSLLPALAALAIYVLAFLLQTRIPDLPREFPRDELRYPAKIGDITAENADRLRFVAEGFSIGEQLTIVDADGIVYRPITIPRRDIAYLVVIAISCLFFWSVSTFIFAPRLDRPGARSFFWITTFFGWAVAIGGIYFVGDRSWLSYAMGYLQISILAVIPLLYLHLGLTFPYRSGFLARARWMMPALVVGSAGIVAWQVFAFQNYFENPGPQAGALLGAPQAAADALLVAETFAGFAILFARGLRSDDILVKRQLYWLLLGFTVGTVPYVFLRTLPSIFGASIPIPYHVDRLLELAIPTVFVLVVIRHRFLDIDVILRRGLMYTSLAAIAIGLYLLLSLALSGYMEPRVSGRAGLVLLLLGMGAGLAFRPLRRWIRIRVDRTAFKLAQNYDRAVQELHTALGHVGGQDELTHVVARRLVHSMHAATVSVVVREGTELRVAGGLAPDVASAAFRAVEERTVVYASTFAARGSTGVPERETDDFPAMLSAGGVVVAAPSRDEKGLMALMMLGRRRTGRRYIARDLRFLDTCADMIGDTLSRIELVQTVSAESFERRRLSELNQHKTEYLSRVAHDLRTPLSSITWASQNLTDGVVGGLNEQQHRYVASIRTAAQHLSMLVTNLVAVSRIDNARGNLDLEGVRLNQVIDEVVGMLRPLAQQSDVVLEFRPGFEPLVVAGLARYLGEVVTNLLDNAIRFSPPHSVVAIDVTNENESDVAVRVRDHGPGIDAAVIETIFERHSQGARSPYSSRQGFGLGLNIVKSYIEQMGGTVEGTNHADGGALFTFHLRRWDAPREASA